MSCYVDRAFAFLIAARELKQRTVWWAPWCSIIHLISKASGKYKVVTWVFIYFEANQFNPMKQIGNQNLIIAGEFLVASDQYHA